MGFSLPCLLATVILDSFFLCKLHNRPTQNSVGWRNEGGNRSIRRTGPALSRWRTWTRVPIPTSGEMSESEKKHLRLRVKQLICGHRNVWSENQTVLPWPYVPQTGTWISCKLQRLALEFRDCGAVPRQGLLLTVERWIEGMWERRLWRQMTVEKSRADMKARQHSWVMCRGWSRQYSLSSPTCQHWQLNKREAGPSNAWPLSTEWDPTQGASLSDWCTELQRRTLGNEAF